jgi:hypothetical protein
MTGTKSRVTLNIAVACCVLTGCGTDDDRPDREAPLAADNVAADSVYAPAEDLVTLPTSRIYYTLTSHDWYARGEPLVHDGRPYEPEGMPVSASLDVMEKAGEYSGVEYYVRSGDPEPAVYVPVFDGYWQRFRGDPNAVALPADAADAGDADSGSDAAAADTSAALR